jgi:hypothetical protein
MKIQDLNLLTIILQGAIFGKGYFMPGKQEMIFREVRPSLVGGPVFKTGGGDEKSPRWVRFPCASAITGKALFVCLS